eukprot:12102925-Ditylum_brightwellii.AAC.1
MTLQQLIQNTEEIWIVLNSRVNGGFGYFGFVVATGSRILWKGNGQSQGNYNQMESLFTENSRGLAALQFLQHIVNNPNELLGPNFNIQMVIDKSLQELLIPYKCTHAWGHQDRKDKRKRIDKKMQSVDSVIRAEENNRNNSLTWEATLNIVADSLATAAYQRLSQTLKKKGEFYPITPTRAYLYINDTPIVKDYCDVIIQA